MPHLTLVRACALAALLLLAQALGLAHGVAHARWGPAQGSLPSAPSALPGLQAGPVQAPPGDFAAATWRGSHQAGDVECRLIDQLGHADAQAPGLQAWLPPAPAAQPVPVMPAVALRSWPAAAYRARAPPR